jgi:hypothetical protein
MTFLYTHAFESYLDSSLVESAYYDSVTTRLAVTLLDDDGDTAFTYVYSHVPFGTYESFRHADSKGEYYNRVIKRQYGPGDNLGYMDDDDFTIRLSSIIDATQAAPVTITASNSPYVSLSAVAEASQAEENFVSLERPESDERVTYKHVVHFTVEGGNEVKTYTVEAGSNVHEATDALAESAKALGIDVTVKGVFISFE